MAAIADYNKAIKLNPRDPTLTLAQKNREAALKAKAEGKQSK